MRAAGLCPVGALLREWRMARGKSQLALAVHAGVSSRHLSFIETGRSAPSRDMVLLLSDALDVPLRERNTLLDAAGYAAIFKETPLEAPEMDQVRQVLEALLSAHGNNPAVVLNRRCDVLMSNDASHRLMAYLLPGEALMSGIAANMIKLTFSPNGAKPFIENWHEVASEMAYRLRRELLSEDDAILREIVGPDIELPIASPALTRDLLTRRPLIMMPLRLKKGELRLNLFSTITTLGTPLDVTLQELRVESLFPADDASRRQLAAIVDGSALT
ncbi:MAG: helix-turn-helix transcriptional regulator [Polyangiaceae bacterium]